MKIPVHLMLTKIYSICQTVFSSLHGIIQSIQCKICLHNNGIKITQEPTIINISTPISNGQETNSQVITLIISLTIIILHTTTLFLHRRLIMHTTKAQYFKKENKLVLFKWIKYQIYMKSRGQKHYLLTQSIN